MHTAKKKIEVIEIDLPAYWAGYLIDYNKAAYTKEQIDSIELWLSDFDVESLECVGYGAGGADPHMADYGDESTTFVTYTFHKRSK